jgi:hypothetical protein
MCQVKNTQLHIIHTLDNYNWDYKSTILKYIQIKKNGLWFQSNTAIYIYLIFILTLCFGQLTIIRPSLQNSQYGACRANNICVVWSPMKLTKCIKIVQNDWF